MLNVKKMLRITGLGIVLTVVGSLATAAEETGPFAHYQPVIDVTKNPGCGVEGRSKPEKIEYHRRLAELYFKNFQEDRERGRNWSWWVHDCFDENATVFLGAVDPLGMPVNMGLMKAAAAQAGVKAPDPSELTGEQRGYFTTFPDWKTQDGTLVVIPFEEGAFFRMMYGGTDADGKFHTIWETNLILVDDSGMITHFEMWNDTIGMDGTTRKAFGKGIKDMGMDGYRAATEAFPKE
jgi:hypothetical protein